MKWRRNDLMTTRDPIDQDTIDAYRNDRAPPGFAARVTHTAALQEQSRSHPIAWGLPAVVLIALVVVAVVWNDSNVSNRPISPRMAVSFSEMPSGLPTLSNFKNLAVPSIAALAAIPTLPTLDLSIPQYGQLKPKANGPKANDLPN